MILIVITQKLYFSSNHKIFKSMKYFINGLWWNIGSRCILPNLDVVVSSHMDNDRRARQLNLAVWLLFIGFSVPAVTLFWSSDITTD